MIITNLQCLSNKIFLQLTCTSALSVFVCISPNFSSFYIHVNKPDLIDIYVIRHLKNNSYKNNSILKNNCKNMVWIKIITINTTSC